MTTERLIDAPALNGEVLPGEDAVERLLIKMDGNIAKIALKLEIKSASLRAMVAKSPRLSAAVDEVFALACDEAVGVLYEGLRDDGSFQNRFYAAKEFLRSREGRKRGFGAEASGAATLELKDAGGHRTITLRWLEPKEEEDMSGLDQPADPPP